MDACTTEPVIRFDVDADKWVMRRRSEAVIKNPTILHDLLLNWRIWDKTDEDIVLLMFRSLASLIREDHPYQAFNIKQLQSIGVVSQIFIIYQVH